MKSPWFVFDVPSDLLLDIVWHRLVLKASAHLEVGSGMPITLLPSRILTDGVQLNPMDIRGSVFFPKVTEILEGAWSHIGTFKYLFSSP